MPFSSSRSKTTSADGELPSDIDSKFGNFKIQSNFRILFHVDIDALILSHLRLLYFNEGSLYSIFSGLGNPTLSRIPSEAMKPELKYHKSLSYLVTHAIADDVC